MSFFWAEIVKQRLKSSILSSSNPPTTFCFAKYKWRVLYLAFYTSASSHKSVISLWYKEFPDKHILFLVPFQQETIESDWRHKWTRSQAKTLSTFGFYYTQINIVVSKLDPCYPIESHVQTHKPFLPRLSFARQHTFQSHSHNDCIRNVKKTNKIKNKCTLHRDLYILCCYSSDEERDEEGVMDRHGNSSLHRIS